MCRVTCNPKIQVARAPLSSSMMRGAHSLLGVSEQVNYCQGMNFLAALLLTWLPTQEAAFGALVVLMHGRGLRELYKQDLQALQVCARLYTDSHPCQCLCTALQAAVPAQAARQCTVAYSCTVAARLTPVATSCRPGCGKSASCSLAAWPSTWSCREPCLCSTPAPGC